MSYVTILLSVVAACALLLMLMYGLVWLMDRKSRASLAFACVAASIVASVVVELGLMHAESPAEWGEWIRWNQVPIFIRVVAILAFVRLYFGTGRPWLMWTVIGMRFVILAIGFSIDPNFNYTRIDSIDHLTFLGERVTVIGAAQASPWQWTATMATGLLLLFVADASLQLWRKGTHDARRTAAVVGGAILLSSASASLYAQLMIVGGWRIPPLYSPPNLLMLAAMTFELSRGTLRASRLARELRESEAQLQVAASAAGLAFWSWDSQSGRIWITPRGREMLDIASDERIDVAQLRSRLPADDLAQIEAALRRSVDREAEEEVQFRIRLRDGKTRWVVAHGRTQVDLQGRFTRLQGVMRDISEQLRAREEIEDLRRALAHVSRVSVLGTLSSSLAHELSQPLGAIQFNAEAAALLLNKPQPNLQELREILDDIQRDDRRAAEVIDGLRALLKRRQLDLGRVSVDALLRDVVLLLKSDAIARNVSLEYECDEGLPPIRGDKVHLSQVLINLLMNAMDAVAEMRADSRRVRVHAHANGAGTIELAVTDSGTGIPTEVLSRIFDPFFTTKSNGMGLGLSVSRTIVEAHQGRITAANAEPVGAKFSVVLPAHE